GAPPPGEEGGAVARQAPSGKTAPLEPLFGGDDVLKFHEVVRRVPAAEDLVRYAVRIASASRPGPKAPGFVNDWVSWGAGLRAAQSPVLGAKARAPLGGRVHLAPDALLAPVHTPFRHRHPVP